MSTTGLTAPPAPPNAAPEHDMRTWVEPAPIPPAPGSELQDPEPFRRWLEGLPADQACGRQHKAPFCPLAQYLRARHGERSDPCVTSASYHVGRHTYAMPRWAQLFVIRVDMPGAAAPRTGTVSAGQALLYLKEALAEEQRLWSWESGR